MEAAKLFNVRDQVVAITGAASGIGLGYAKVMASNGARLALMDINANNLEAAVALLKESGADVRGTSQTSLDQKACTWPFSKPLKITNN